MQVHVNRDTGQIRVLQVGAGVDTGQVIDPDGVRNQIARGDPAVVELGDV
jgi:CO/xanthine dehydrogenase Mo-binding subunit